MGGETCDVLIADGKIAGFGQFEVKPGMIVEGGANAIAVPGLIDAHTHLDKSMLGMRWHVNGGSENRRARIDFEREHRKALGIDPYRQSMRHAISLVANGCTHIRSHVDVDSTHGLSLVEGVWRRVRA
jgi:cytosine deaminase